MRLVLFVLTLLTIGWLAGCGGSDDGVTVTTPTVASGDNVTYGEIERLPGGTAVITSDHTFVSAVCDQGMITLTTTAARFTGNMDCAAMPTDEVINRFVDLQITINIGGGRLKIESPEGGSLDFPATDVRS